MRNIFWTALLLTLTSIGVGCDRDAGLPPEPPTPVTVHDVTDDDAAGSQKYTANIQPEVLVHIDAQVSGNITKLAMRPGADGVSRPLQGGDKVDGGTFLAQVDESSYKASLERAQDQLDGVVARFTDAKEEFGRTQELFDAGVDSQAQLDRMRAAYESSRSEVAKARHGVDSAQVDYDRCTIASPSAGTVIEREVEVGDLVNPGDEVFQVADLSRMKVVFGVSALTAQRVSIGDVITMLVDSLDGLEIAGTVTRVAPAADATSRLYDIEATVPNTDGKLRIGMIASLRLPPERLAGPEADKPFVPLDAIIRPPGASKGVGLYVVEKASGAGSDAGVARLRDVKTGEVFGSQVRVLSGLSTGDRVIVRGATIVQDGDAVRVIQ